VFKAQTAAILYLLDRQDMIFVANPVNPVSKNTWTTKGVEAIIPKIMIFNNEDRLNLPTRIETVSDINNIDKC